MKIKGESSLSAHAEVIHLTRQIQEISWRTFRHRLLCEKMLVDISTSAIHIRSIQDFLDECVERMGRALDVEGVFIWDYDPENETMSNVSEWVTEGYPRYKEQLQNLPASRVTWALGILGENRIINFEDIEDIPECFEKEMMRMMKIKSILMFPMFVRGRFFGVLGFETYKYYRKWKEEDIYILRTASQIITKSIENYRAEKALEKANKELEYRVRRRTAKLYAAKKELEEKQKELLVHKEEMLKLNKSLLEANDALSTLARNFEKGRKEILRRVASITSLKIVPLLTEMREKAGSNEQKAELDVLATYISELSDGLIKKKKVFSTFSNMEAKISAMIKNGLTSQQIARQLNISLETVKTHRRNIRKKLGIQNKKKNLRSYLLSHWNELLK